MLPTHDEHWLELKVPPLATLIIALAGIWVFDQLFPISGLLGSKKSLLSLSLLALGLLISITGVVSFKLAKTSVHPINVHKTSTLVSSGIFRFSRNPMYLGMLFILISWIVRLENPYCLLWAVLFVWYVNRFQIVPEERMLGRVFGEAYELYRARVRRWV